MVFHEQIFHCKESSAKADDHLSNFPHKLPGPADLAYPYPSNINLNYPDDSNFQSQAEPEQNPRQNMESSKANEPSVGPDFSPNVIETFHIPRRSDRSRKTPTYLQDFICQQALSPTHS